jgi:Flp pilus assembly protein TadG
MPTSTPTPDPATPPDQVTAPAHPRGKGHQRCPTSPTKPHRMDNIPRIRKDNLDGNLQRGRESERGSALAESVIVLGLLALLVFGVIQYAADEHAEQAAQSAASLALATARAQNGTAVQGQAAAQQLLAELTGAIHDTSVSVQRSATQVTVRVTGHVDTLLGLTQTITATCAGPVEVFEPNALALAAISPPLAEPTGTGPS